MMTIGSAFVVIIREDDCKCVFAGYCTVLLFITSCQHQLCLCGVARYEHYTAYSIVLASAQHGIHRSDERRYRTIIILDID